MKEIELLRSKNPSIKIFDVNGEEFKEYGVVFEEYDVNDIMVEATKLETPSEGTLYLALVEGFENLPIAKKLKMTYLERSIHRLVIVTDTVIT